jgi:hypothetical protein
MKAQSRSKYYPLLRYTQGSVCYRKVGFTDAPAISPSIQNVDPEQQVCNATFTGSSIHNQSAADETRYPHQTLATAQLVSHGEANPARQADTGADVECAAIPTYRANFTASIIGLYGDGLPRCIRRQDIASAPKQNEGN